jgi:exopolysaccharide production protein ExoQ
MLAELSAMKNLRALLTNLGLVMAALVLIVQSHSVTGMLISSGALLIASFLWFYQKFQAGPLVKIVTTGCVVLVVILVGVVGRDELLYGFGRDITLTGRTVVWSLAWQSIMDRPILGFGYGSYWASQAGAEYYFGDSWIPPGAHNGFLDALLGGGAVLMGLVLYQTWLLIKRSIGCVLASQSSTGWFVVLVGGLFPIYNLVESIYLKDYSVSTLLFVTALFTVGIRDQRKAN